MKIYAFADEASPSLNGQIAAMKRNQLSGIEIRNIDGRSVSDIPLDQAKEIKRRLDDEGLTVWSVGSPIGKIDIERDDFSKHLDRFRHTLDVARALDAGNIRLFSFYVPAGNADDYKQEVIDRLSRFVELSIGSGVTLCHENEKGIYGDVASRCLELYQALPDMKGIFDPANFIQCGQETLSAWAMLKQYIKYLHVKDAQADGIVVPAGKGIGHLPEIIQDYLAVGGQALTVEPHLRVFDGLRALEHGERPRVDTDGYASGDDAFDAACAALKNIL